MPTNFCPECGTKAVAGQKFCAECGSKFTGEPESPSTVVRSDISTEAALKDTVVSRSTVKAGGNIEGSAISRSTVRTESAGIRDAVISHSTITQTETHQHFGESVGTYEAQMDLGRTAFEGKNWEEAVDFFNTALKIDARGHEPWFYKGISCAELRRTDEAVTNLRRALKLSGDGRPALITEIKSLADRTARSGGLQETSANELIGKSRAELQRSTAATSQARTEKDKGLAGALALDMFVLPGLGSTMRTDQVVEGMEKRQAADKHEAEGRRLEEEAKGHASEAVKLYNSAIRLCDLVLEFERQDEYSLLKRGELFYRLRLYDDACKSYETLLGFNPDHKDALRMRGMCFTAQGKRVPPPPGTVPAPEPAGKPAQPPQQAGPSQLAQAGASAQPARPIAPSGIPPAGPRSPMIPQPVPSAQPQAAPLHQSPQGRPAQPAYPAQPGPQQPAHMVQQPAYPSQPAPQQPVQAAMPQYPAQPGAYQTAPRPGPAAPAAAGANPCPFCRGEMSFVKERGVWQCGSCRQFSARPAR
jgi:tetratricopeptide (TPR) repeat protein/ribosomal protein L37AE/L43A